MRKFFVDTSKYKISGQEIIQKSLADMLNSKGLLTNSNDADILIYSQFDDITYAEAKSAKNNGKIVVFCHHYSSANIFKNTFVIKNNAFDAIDYHVVLTDDSEFYQYLIMKGIDKSHILIHEFATFDYDLFHQPIDNMREYDLIFVGRYDKGFDIFVDYVEAFNITKCIALCPDVHKSKKSYSFQVITDAVGEQVYEYLYNSRFIWSYSSYNVPRYHLETTMHEAITYGCVNLVDNMYDYVLNTTDVTTCGCTKTIFISEDTRQHLADTAKNWQHENYLTRTQMLETLINKISILTKDIVC